jgi:DNA helicase-2/ATP-dependent DNA helicase PcrA
MKKNKINNKLILASAGSGKTTFLIKSALSLPSNEKILITTYTEANEAEITRKIIKINGLIPENIQIQTWFSFLIQHGVKPYQGTFHQSLFLKPIRGMLLVNNPSGIKYSFANEFNKKINVPYNEEREFEKHYLASSRKIYSDKISKFVFNCNLKVKNEIIDRLARIYNHVFIDEVQDLAGYDLELIKLLFKSNISTVLVGDPRQVTYLTHIEKKNDKYKNGFIKDYLLEKCKSLIGDNIDETTLNVSHRNDTEICLFSSKLYPKFPSPNSCECSNCRDLTIEHKGIYLVQKKDIQNYVLNYKPIEIGWNKKMKPINPVNYFNFGESKGLGFDDVLIYPTNDMIEWLKNHNYNLKNETRAKFYVGITRARYSVAIVVENFNDDKFKNYKKYEVD